MRGKAAAVWTTTILIAALVLVPTVDAADHPYAYEPDSADNGVVMMVHGQAEPNPFAGTPAPPVHEALYATTDNDTITLALIPYGPDEAGTWRPRNLSGADPELEIETPGLDDLRREPNVDAADHDRCEDETTIPGHEGPLQACLVFEIPSSAFIGRNAPALKLHWDGGIEAYNVPAHALMHDRFEGGPVPVSQADGLTGQPTPFLIENHLDPQP